MVCFEIYSSGFNYWILEFVHHFSADVIVSAAGVGKKCDDVSLDLLNAFASVGHGCVSVGRCTPERE